MSTTDPPSPDPKVLFCLYKRPYPDRTKVCAKLFMNEADWKRHVATEHLNPFGPMPSISGYKEIKIPKRSSVVNINDHDYTGSFQYKGNLGHLRVYNRKKVAGYFHSLKPDELEEQATSYANRGNTPPAPPKAAPPVHNGCGGCSIM